MSGLTALTKYGRNNLRVTNIAEINFLYKFLLQKLTTLQSNQGSLHDADCAYDIASITGLS